MNPLVSVVVPVYRVEQYLDTCVRSIVSQSYDNIEVLLVDDGSPDNCGTLCEAWSKRDHRVKAYHKDNGGLSSARKYGLERAAGDFVLFVDSDDWIETDSIQALMDEAERTDADIVLGSFVKQKGDEILVHDIGRNRLYTSQKALYEVIIDKDVNNFAWGFICKKNLYDRIGYPSDRRKFEDLTYTYQLFRQATKIAHINKPFYHYLRRDDSILGGWSLNVALAFVVAHQIRFSDLSHTHPELGSVMLRSYYDALASAKKHAASSTKDDLIQSVTVIRSEIRPFYRQNKKAMKEVMNSSFSTDMTNCLFLTFPILYRAVVRRKKGK